MRNLHRFPKWHLDLAKNSHSFLPLPVHSMPVDSMPIDPLDPLLPVDIVPVDTVPVEIALFCVHGYNARSAAEFLAHWSITDCGGGRPPTLATTDSCFRFCDTGIGLWGWSVGSGFHPDGGPAGGVGANTVANTAVRSSILTASLPRADNMMQIRVCMKFG